MDTEQYINKLFVDAGWSEGRKVSVKKQLGYSFNSAYKNAVKIIEEYGGLNVGETGAGREQAASDISFRSQPLDFGKVFRNYWRNLKCSLFAFASAHHDHMLLLVDDDDQCYIFTDPDEELYLVGNFDNLVNKVLLGLDYGLPLRKA